MKAFLIKFCVLLVLLAMAASGASATVGYVHEPTFDPQRTMFWTFDSEQTWQTPITAVGPTWDTGDWTCDEITFSPNLQWYGVNSNWVDHQGMIGLDNSQGPGQTVSITFHINNYQNQNPIKWLWFEGTGIFWNMGVEDRNARSNVPPGYQSSPPSYMLQDDLNPGERVDMRWRITPNPPWEEVIITAWVPAGGGALIDSVFVSTACVPEPSALMALGSGLVGLIGFASRKRRA